MTKSSSDEIVVLCGGVGAAKLLAGLVRVTEPAAISAVVNIADDETIHGLHISPDLDTITYTLAGEINPETGWGLIGESWNAMEMVSKYGGIDWFKLGDRDIGTHLYRTQRFSEGAQLHEITEEISAAWNIPISILPASNDRIKTRITIETGDEITFQDYFVRLAHEVAVKGVRFEGVKDAKPCEGVIERISRSSLIIIAPSNPIVSIGPILAIPGIREALTSRRDHVIAISGIVGGKAIKGPADRLLKELSHEPSVVGVARLYHEITGTLVIDEVDLAQKERVEQEGVNCIVTNTIMNNPEQAASLCRTILNEER